MGESCLKKGNEHLDQDVRSCGEVGNEIEWLETITKSKFLTNWVEVKRHKMLHKWSKKGWVQPVE